MALNPFAPNPWPPFSKAINQYIQLQYNFVETQLPQLPQALPAQVLRLAQLGQTLGQSAAQRLLFNPFTLLVHGSQYLNANSYAFSVDDAAGFQSNTGEGLVVAVGGPKGLPNNIPVPNPPISTRTSRSISGIQRRRTDLNGPNTDLQNVADIDFRHSPLTRITTAARFVVPIATKRCPAQ